MRTPRVHLPHDLAVGHTLELPAATAHHLLRVLRLPPGAGLRLFNGEPGDWLGELQPRGKRGAAVTVTAFEPRVVESPLAITLVQGISRGQRMDYTLEKGTELGVRRVIPVVMARTQAAPAGERIGKKARHWEGVLTAAAGQCGRTRAPELAPQQAFSDWLQAADCRAHPHLLLDPTAEQGPGDVGPTEQLTLIAGPEGGFSPGEREAALAAGCTGIRFGPRVLRTETAAVAALAVLQALYGDLG
ncbi:MAG: 16S rRNA (uracil(1498)-N(3))-methyltransferase [Halofilum sp. (in: g-proteobacteria)]|nr:16S rRNA (uracil(1498)-N(3))-methyltransferase [Halofilum sp. (in: g-proteobacteria)]